MSEITITINGQNIACNESESILQIARRKGIEIPAICYLSNCSPTVACKLCMVDIDGKRNYSCNAKAKDAMMSITPYNAVCVIKAANVSCKTIP